MQPMGIVLCWRTCNCSPHVLSPSVLSRLGGFHKVYQHLLVSGHSFTLVGRTTSMYIRGTEGGRPNEREGLRNSARLIYQGMGSYKCREIFENNSPANLLSSCMHPICTQDGVLVASHAGQSALQCRASKGQSLLLVQAVILLGGLACCPQLSDGGTKAFRSTVRKCEHREKGGGSKMPTRIDSLLSAGCPCFLVLSAFIRSHLDANDTLFSPPIASPTNFRTPGA